MALRISEPAPRYFHNSAQVASKAVVHSGWTQDYSLRSRKCLAARVEVFDLYSEKWESKRSTGEAPAPGVRGAASTSSQCDLFTYGGRDGDGKFVDSLHQLSSKTYQWCRLTAGGERPIPKSAAAMVACSDGLALLGGYGAPLGPTQRGSSFIKDDFQNDGSGWTNEFHLYHLNENAWRSPATTGERPPPCSNFSFTSIDQKRAVLFGGYNAEQGRMNDVYIIDLWSMHWTKLKISEKAPWPGKRCNHAACCLNYDQEHPQLLITGGMDNEYSVLGDAWILDVDSGRWRKVSNTIQPRRGHSSTAFNISSTLTEVTMFGGSSNPLGENKLADTTVMQFRVKENTWELSGVVGPRNLGQSEERLREKIEFARFGDYEVSVSFRCSKLSPNATTHHLSDHHFLLKCTITGCAHEGKYRYSQMWRQGESKGQTSHSFDGSLAHSTKQSTSSLPRSCHDLSELIRFRGRERKINVPQEVGTHYQQFGILLLNDPMGSRVRNIAHKNREEPEHVNLEILRQWLEEKGESATWKTLVETLEDIGLRTLAMEIRNIKL